MGKSSVAVVRSVDCSVIRGNKSMDIDKPKHDNNLNVVAVGDTIQEQTTEEKTVSAIDDANKKYISELYEKRFDMFAHALRVKPPKFLL